LAAIAKLASAACASSIPAWHPPTKLIAMVAGGFAQPLRLPQRVVAAGVREHDRRNNHTLSGVSSCQLHYGDHHRAATTCHSATIKAAS
jgi:hypothetical protein